MKWVLMVVLLSASPAWGQDTLRLPALQAAAVAHDARAGEMALEASASALRRRNIDAGWLPSIKLTGRGSRQSEVPAIPIRIPGVDVPEPPLDRYAATVEVGQLVYDGGVSGERRREEEAKLASSRARVEAALYPLRAQVNAAFFQALGQRERRAEIDALESDLDAKLDLARAQVAEGAGLAGDTAAILARLLEARQGREEAEAAFRTALATIEELTGLSLSGTEELALPDLADEVARVRAMSAAPADSADAVPVDGHPQYAVFMAQREELRRQSALIAAQDGPRLAAFGEWGYGRPGLRQFTDAFHGYWLAGLELSWQPWNWRITQRKQEVLGVQREIVDAEEAAFTARLRRDVLATLATIDRLAATLGTDDRIIALREQVDRQAQAQLAERAITPAAYVEVRTDLQNARLARRRHRIELARARADYLTTLGVAPW